MASKGKGKAVVDQWSSGKRKREDGDEFGGLNRKNPGVLKFFDVSADVDGDNGSVESEFEDYFMQEEPETEVKDKTGPGKAHSLPFFPKEEELSGDELERVLEERYRDGSGFVTYADDKYESKRSIEKNSLMPSAKDPTIWKVKCMVGRERHSAFCLMQKYVDLETLGTKLQIISAFAVDYIKGFIFIEADKQSDVNEACNGLCSVYASRVAPVPKNEVSHLLSVRNKCNGVCEGTWARVKNGNYKGDLAEVVAVNDARKRATVRLIPRINLQALVEKLGGGVPLKRISAPPAPRLINSSELEEFRPLIQCRRDRDTGKVFEVLDGLMLKDGYLYKKVSIESLNCWGVTPSQEELNKFQHSANDQLEDTDWLKQIFGEQRKKRSRLINLSSDKGGGKGGKVGKGGKKGEGTSESSVVNSFDVHDFVCFGRKDFGVIVGIEKDNNYKILKEGPKGQVVVTVELHYLKNVPFDKKFTALDHQMKTISINDTVRVLEGPSQGRQGTVKQIYRGVLFLYDENEMENNGYFCFRSLICEKVKIFGDACDEKADELGLPGLGDNSSSPKSPLSPKKPWQTRENNNDFKQGDKDGIFSIGQTLRIKKGPLKGFLCHVLAIRRSDITVKLDSQPKVLTVHSDLLSVVQGKNSVSTNMDPESSSMKPFELLGTEGGSTDWMEGAGTTAGSSSWNAAGPSAERSSWSSFSTSSFSLQPEFNSANPFGSAGNDSKIDVGDDTWEKKVITKQDSSSGADDRTGGWGKSADCWGKATVGGSGSNQENSCKRSEDPWDKGKNVSANPGSTWDSATAGTNQVGSWGTGKNTGREGSVNKEKDVVGGGVSVWGKAVGSQAQGTGKDRQEDSWCKTAEKCSSQDDLKESKTEWKSATAPPVNLSGGWGSAGGGWAVPEMENRGHSSAWKRDESMNGSQENCKGATGWTKAGNNSKDQINSWKKPKEVADGGSWDKQDAASSWQTQGGSSSWNKAGLNAEDKSNEQGNHDENWGKPKSFKEDGHSSWQKQGGISSWNKAGASVDDKSNEQGNRNENWDKPNSVKEDGGSSWKQDGGSSSKQGGGSSWNHDGGSSLKQAGGSSWGKQAGGSSWGKQDGDKNDPDQQISWESSKSFEGGFGYGGRRGRWGRGGRDHFGRGRSFSEDQTSGWNKGVGQQDSWSGGGSASGKPSSWNNDQGRDWGKTKVSDGDQGNGWNTVKASVGDQRPGWSSGTKADIGSSGWDSKISVINEASNGEQKSSWRKGSTTNVETGGGWNKGISPVEVQNKPWNTEMTNLDGNQSSGWGSKGSWRSKSSSFGSDQTEADGNEDGFENFGNRGRGGNWRGGRGRGSSNQGGFGSRDSFDRNSFGGRGGSSKWNEAKSSDVTCSSGWNKGSAANEESGGSGAEGSGWSTVKASVENPSSGWKSGASAGGGSSGWKKGSGTTEEAGGTCDHGGWRTETTNLDRNQSSGWSSKVSQEANEDKHSGWNANAGKVKDSEASDQGSGWDSRRCSDGGLATGWGQSKRWKSTSESADWSQKSNWNASNAFGSDQSETVGNELGVDNFSNKGSGGGWRGGRGRGSFDRGGFGGRGSSESDRGGFGDRGDPGRGSGGRRNSYRGGFGGRGRFEGGDFGGRGRGRRDQSGCWNPNGSGEEKSSNWGNQGNSNNEGWKGDSAGNSWSQGGGSTWKQQRTPGNDAPNSWKHGGGSTWNPPSAPGNDAADSWNQGGGSTWKLQTPCTDAANSWKQGGSSSTWKPRTAPNNDAANSWNQGGGSISKPQTTGTDAANSWNRGGGSTAPGGSQGSGWNQSASAKEASGGGGQDSGWN